MWHLIWVTPKTNTQLAKLWIFTSIHRIRRTVLNTFNTN